MHYIERRKQQESTENDINGCIKHNTIRNISLNIGEYIGENDYGAI